MTFTNNTTSTNNKISSRAFNSYANKSEDFENIKKIPRSLKREDKSAGSNASNASSVSSVSSARTNKKTTLKNKDARLSYKNRRSINKDWKDFNTLM
jgi:hypothetical protein